MPATNSGIRFREGEAPGACFMSGRIVYDEIFMDGRVVSRYWNPNGQVWPEMHLEGLGWKPDQPADSFHVGVDGMDLSGGFDWVSAESPPDPSAYRARIGADGNPLPVEHGVISLDHARTGINVKVHTRLDGSDFLIRWLEITNKSRKAVGITQVAPFAGMFWTHRYEEHLPPDFVSPFELSYNHMFEWGREGDFWFEPIRPGTKSVNGGKKGRSGWGRPAFWARNVCNGQTFVCELAWAGNYEFAVDCRLTDTDWGRHQVVPAGKFAELYFRMGLSGHDSVLRVLDPGETVATPAVHLALFQCNTDEIVHATHDHVRNVVMPEQLPGRHVEVEANHRGYLCDRETVAAIRKDVDVAAAVGAEMYVIDAGWYGNLPNRWPVNTGDWFEGEWMREGGGLKAVADHVHDKNMKFGLWVEIEAAGANSTLKKTHNRWLMKRDGRPIAGGRALDLTNPEVAAWEESEIERLITAYDLDMYRIDHNHCITPSANRKYRGFTEDLTWRYYDAFFAMFDSLRKKFPNKVFQNCAGGGGRLDWGTLSRFHNTELSDWMRLPRAFKILSGTTMSLPPEILLRTFGTEVGEHSLEGDLDSQLRLCFCRPIFRGIAPTVDDLTPYLAERIGHFLDLYRTYIRPIMIDSLVFHHTPFLKLAEASPWCVLEYAKKDRSASVAVMFRTSAAAEGPHPDEYLLRLRGIDHNRRYRVLIDGRRLDYAATGTDLFSSGIRVRLEAPQTSELVIVSEVS